MLEEEPEKAMERDLMSVYGKLDAIEHMTEIRHYYKRVYGIKLPYEDE